MYGACGTSVHLELKRDFGLVGAPEWLLDHIQQRSVSQERQMQTDLSRTYTHVPLNLS